MKQLFRFLTGCLYAAASIAGLGFAIQDREYLLVGCITALVVLAFPTVRKLFLQLIHKD